MIYIEYNETMIMNELNNDEYANWTYDQAQALTSHLFERTEETDEELDLVALRGEFNVYSNRAEVRLDYGLEPDEDIDATILDCADGTILVSSF
tara:strand:+ start:410 stop:691 length:282 start_codon:yes stop_codon:yes gene_type:complete